MMSQRVFITKARSILSDNAGVRKLPNQRSGKWLDESRLGLVKAGETRVFQKPLHRQFSQYHVTLLVDCSGSMADCNPPTKLEYAVWCSHALAYALKEAGALIDVILFAEHTMKLEAKTFLNAEQLNVDAHAFCNSYGGDTLEGHAMKFAIENALASHAQGKIIMSMVDGGPGDGMLLRQEIKKARKAGILTLGVGILSDQPKYFYGENHTALVSNLKELYSSMAKLIEKNIVRG